MRTLSLLYVFIAVLVFPALLKAGTEKTVESQEFVTVFSSNLYGESEPCG